MSWYTYSARGRHNGFGIGYWMIKAHFLYFDWDGIISVASPMESSDLQLDRLLLVNWVWVS